MDTGTSASAGTGGYGTFNPVTREYCQDDVIRAEEQERRQDSHMHDLLNDLIRYSAADLFGSSVPANWYSMPKGPKSEWEAIGSGEAGLRKVGLWLV